MSYVTLTSPPVSFEPSPPGAPRPPTLGATFSSSLMLYQKDGANRLLMSESYGYSVLSLSQPTNPTALYYRDNRLPLGGGDSVTHHGDGQSNVNALGVSADGQRAIFSLAGPADNWHTIAGQFNGSYGFLMRGSFPPYRGWSALVQHIGSRYIAYNLSSGVPTAADITTLPTSFAMDNMTSESTTWPGGNLGILVGNYLLYIESGIRVVNISNPGPIGSITNNMPSMVISPATLGLATGQTIHYFTAAVDPTDSSKLWILVSVKLSSHAVKYYLVSVSNLVPTVVGLPWSVPNTGLLSQDSTIGSSLVVNNGSMYVLMWNQKDFSNCFLYSTSVDQWANINSSSPPNSTTIPSHPDNFVIGYPSQCLSIDNNIYMYLPTGRSAYVVPLTCVPSGGGGGGGGTVPGAPTGVGASKINDTTIRVTWTPPV